MNDKDDVSFLFVNPDSLLNSNYYSNTADILNDPSFVSALNDIQNDILFMNDQISPVVDTNQSNAKKNLRRQIQSKVVDVNRISSPVLKSNREHLFNRPKSSSIKNSINSKLKAGNCKNINTLPSTNCRNINILPSTVNPLPIQLILQGRNCHSLQNLTDSQLKVVSGILCQEYKQEPKDGFYQNMYVDPDTKTNILYEVMHISDDGKDKKRKMGRPAKGQCNQTSEKEDETNIKINVARTRSGRVSRPPRHMVRDYKSSEQLISDIEGDNESSVEKDISLERRRMTKGNDVHLKEDVTEEIAKDNGDNVETPLFGLLEPNKRHFKRRSLCPTCGKVYLGYKRMSIHFEKYPEHRNDQFLEELKNMQKESSIEITAEQNTNCDGNIESVLSTLGETPSENCVTLKRKRPNYKMPGKTAVSSLKQMLSICDPADIVKYAGPVITNVVSMWDLLLMRTTQLKQDGDTLIEVLFSEIRLLIKQIRDLKDKIIKPLLDTNKENISHEIKIGNEDILQHVLGISPGMYVVNTNSEHIFDSLLSTNNITKKRIKIGNGNENLNRLNSDSNKTQDCRSKLLKNLSTGLSARIYEPDKRKQSVIEAEQLSDDKLTDFICPNDSVNANEDYSGFVNCKQIPGEEFISGKANDKGSCNLLDLKTSEDEMFFQPSDSPTMNFDSNLISFSSQSEMPNKDDLLNCSDYMAHFNSKSVDPISSRTTLQNFDTFPTSSMDIMNEFDSLPLLSINNDLPDSKPLSSTMHSSLSEDIFNTLKQLDESNTQSMMEHLNQVTNFQSAFSHSNVLSETSSVDILDFSSLNSNFHS